MPDHSKMHDLPTPIHLPLPVKEGIDYLCELIGKMPVDKSPLQREIRDGLLQTAAGLARGEMKGAAVMLPFGDRPSLYLVGSESEPQAPDQIYVLLVGDSKQDQLNALGILRDSLRDKCTPEEVAEVEQRYRVMKPTADVLDFPPAKP